MHIREMPRLSLSARLTCLAWTVVFTAGCGSANFYDGGRTYTREEREAIRATIREETEARRTTAATSSTPARNSSATPDSSQAKAASAGVVSPTGSPVVPQTTPVPDQIPPPANAEREPDRHEITPLPRIRGNGLDQPQIVVYASSRALASGKAVVYVDGEQKGTLSREFTTRPSCGAANAVTVRVLPGAHRLSAQHEDGTRWGPVTKELRPGECYSWALGAKPPSPQERNCVKTTISDQNSIQKLIKGPYKIGDGCWTLHVVQSREASMCALSRQTDCYRTWVEIINRSSSSIRCRVEVEYDAGNIMTLSKSSIVRVVPPNTQQFMLQTSLVARTVGADAWCDP